MDMQVVDELPFENRGVAGIVLGRRLSGMTWPSAAIVLGLPRGGVPVAKEIARILRLPLDVLVVRKVRHPDQPELAIGAVAAGGVTVRNPAYAASIDAEHFETLAAKERAEVNKREVRFRWGRAPLDLDGKTAILVDDGLATGETMRAAVNAARAMGATYLVAAAPVGSREALRHLQRYADRIVCLRRPERFEAVGAYYADFHQLQDAEVRDVLAA